MNLLRAALGDAAFADLPSAIQAVHEGPVDLSGQIQVTTHPRPFWRWAARLAGLPRATQGDVPFRFQTRATSTGATWHRHIRSAVTTSTFIAHPSVLVEKLGAVTVTSRPEVTDGTVALVVQRITVLGVPLPRPLWPSIETQETGQGDRYHFDITLRAPLGGAFLVRYRGWLDTGATRMKTAPSSPAATAR